MWDSASTAMIRLTRLKRGPFLLNPDLIEHVEMTPDTVITLTTGHQFMVLETAEDVVHRIVEFRRAVHQPPSAGPSRTGPEEADPAP